MKMQKPAMLALALLLVFASVGANTVCSAAAHADAPIVYQGRWMGLALAGVMISVMIVGIFYMGARAVSAPKVEAWAKNELYQTIASAVMVSMFAVAVFSLTSMSSVLDLEGKGRSLMVAAMDYSEYMRNLMTTEFVGLTIFNSYVNLIGTLSISARPMGVAGISFQLTPIFKPLMDANALLINAVMMSVGEWNAHALFICFIEREMLSLFLPLGVLLRAFAPTRAAGGALIAIAFGLYFVYPFMLSLNAVIMSDLYPVNLAAGWRLMVNGIFGSIGVLSTIGLMVLGLGWLSGVKAMLAMALLIIPTTLSLAKFVLSTVLIGSIILPIFNIFITLTFIRELAKFLGSDINLSALTKLV